MASISAIPESLFAGLGGLSAPGPAPLRLPADRIQPRGDVVSVNVVSVNPDTAAVGELLSGDPELLARFYAAMQILENLNPGLARALARNIRAGLELSNRVSLRIEVRARSAAVSVQGAGVSVSVAHSEVSIRVEFEAGPGKDAPPASDPIVIDLDANGIRATGLAGGRVFDINADGQPDLTSFIASGDGLLALDRNRNGRIDDGSELFGDQRGAVNGFEELRKLDQNRDGVIDSGDSAYRDLLVLTSEGELGALDHSGVAAISLDYSTVGLAVNPDVVLAQAGSFRRSDGTTGLAADLLLSYRPLR